MPVVQPRGKVLVSGASGFIGAWVVRSLLDAGYTVRGTVRSVEKGERVKALFDERFEYIVVKDVAEEGAFDEAVKDVDAVQHIASPFYWNADDPQELIKPAVQGTTNLLESVLKHGSSVKRIVAISSSIAVSSYSPEHITLNESMWNDDSPAEVQKLGREATGYHKYAAAKSLAERALWQFVEKHKKEIQWDAVVLAPPYVFGPAFVPADSLGSLATSVQEWYAAALGAPWPPAAPVRVLDASYVWVDVRDLAMAHVRALEAADAGGERILISAGTFSWNDFVELGSGKSVNSEGRVYMVDCDTSKARRLLGMDEYRSKEVVTRDLIAQFKRMNEA